VKVSVDTNVLVRCAVRDDEAQARVAEKTLKGASLIAVALPTLCEFVWVLRSVYGFADTEIGSAVRALLSSEKVVCDRLAAEAGLALLEAGGDFADGVIAHEGTWLGAETFLSFDKAAVAMLSEQGYVAKHLR
jgi:predicted nucleic-acid-binding protein